MYSNVAASPNNNEDQLTTNKLHEDHLSTERESPFVGPRMIYFNP